MLLNTDDIWIITEIFKKYFTLSKTMQIKGSNE